ncbi:D-tyrosyl-tRNA(Tyr) deacylase [Echinococcus granulosus]|uniref:D-aminoacyl-tRNA deacylase n=1 Tax=Echinococcus granulosus TaxID=6210 RepID=W6U8M4_ECHGR|nr:D-tyrosyl-tRNA(Tyr) deacylase [Echinococcus granulosus]EUB57633.1 D-tyrosyl-tRNA(Tyr) deacylase [Echinococcus granulosus]
MSHQVCAISPPHPPTRFVADDIHCLAVSYMGWWRGSSAHGPIAVLVVLPVSLSCQAMRVVIQRVKSASVHVDGQLISEIGRGLMVLVGISRDDGEKDVAYMARKIVNLRLFEDEEKHRRWDRSVKDIGGEILCVSQTPFIEVLNVFLLNEDVKLSVCGNGILILSMTFEWCQLVKSSDVSVGDDSSRGGFLAPRTAAIPVNNIHPPPKTRDQLKKGSLSRGKFTLYSLLKGNKLDFHLAMSPDPSMALYESFLSKVRSEYKAPDKVKGGQLLTLFYPQTAFYYAHHRRAF